MMELLRRSILYIEPVDPVYWCGALRKCEGRILPCLQVQWCTCRSLSVFEIKLLHAGQPLLSVRSLHCRTIWWFWGCWCLRRQSIDTSSTTVSTTTLRPHPLALSSMASRDSTWTMASCPVSSTSSISSTTNLAWRYFWGAEVFVSRVLELWLVSDTDISTCTLSCVDQSHRGGERDWSEDGFLCPAPFLCLNGRPVSATQEGYRGGVA